MTMATSDPYARLGEGFTAFQPTVFDGIGVFCAWDWRSALALRDSRVRWVAVSAQNEWVDANAVHILKNEFEYVHVWEAAASEGQALVDRLGADGYIGQCEGNSQLRACLSLPGLVAPKAMIGYPQSCDPLFWPDGWECIPEVYTNANPNATGAAVLAICDRVAAFRPMPCFGCYDASGEQPGVGKRLSLRSYLASLSAQSISVSRGFSVYLSETLTPDDRDFLR